MQHIYIDGSKFEANANKYTWVWKKATEKFRYKLCEKLLRKLRKSTQKSHGVEYRFQLILNMYQIILNEIVDQLVAFMGSGYKYICLREAERKSKSSVIMNI